MHSIYPSKNIEVKLPRKIIKNFARANDKIQATQPLLGGDMIITIPYRNTESIIRYVIVFKVDSETLITKAYLQVNNFFGQPLFTTYPEICEFIINTILPDGMETPIEFTRFMNSLAFANLSSIEKIIDEMEKDTQDMFRNEE